LKNKDAYISHTTPYAKSGFYAHLGFIKKIISNFNNFRQKLRKMPTPDAIIISELPRQHVKKISQNLHLVTKLSQGSPMHITYITVVLQ